MTSKIKTLIAGSLFICIAGVSHAKDVATVNGKGISQKDYEQFLTHRLGSKDKAASGANRQRVIEEMVNRELIYQDAVKQGITKDSTFQYQLEQLKRDAIMQAAISKNMSANPITDMELKNEYETKIKKANVKEYKASHILLKTEKEAKDVIKELNNGAVFSDVAKAKSTGPSGKNGGDLGWFNPSQMVPAFSQAVAKMKKGAITKEPVKTQFGWHVIKLADSRKLEPPKFDEVKKQLHQFLQSKRLQDYVLKLRKKGKIEVK